jgi:DNA-binding transcriptional MerR regulator/methylmalonyl-CoA mutase cobalamin-binding subunit
LSRSKLLNPGWLNISAVERETGLSKDSLRVWERRYGFPSPARDGSGERLYSPDQVSKLRMLRQLVDAGHRPHAVAALPPERLTELLNGPDCADPARDDPEIGEMLKLLHGRETDLLQQRLQNMLHRQGLGVFARRFAPQLTRAVGLAWAQGRLAIHEEHLYTQQLTAVFREAIDRVATAALPGTPKVLLTTFSNEPHGLGLLMAEAVLVMAGAKAISLGVQTPTHAIAAAARDYDAAVVAISLSAWSKARSARASLIDLRDRLPGSVEIWAGGSCAGLRPLDGVRLMPSLEDIDAAVARFASKG